MKINATSFLSPVQNAYKKANFTEDNKKETRMDSIELSNTAKNLNKINMNDELKSSDRVMQIKNQIENGTYQIDSREIAKKILSNIDNNKSFL
ncbi:MAG: flagellar biosynthesis anti-sigma factor FlgM [Peptostreptococcaceae bacterium]